MTCTLRFAVMQFSAIFFGFMVLAGDSWAWEGVVVRVQDGDTVLVAPEGTTHGDILVRLYGIDAPELDQPGDAVKIVSLSEDRYNRVIGLLISNGTTLNYEQIRTGQAWVYEKYCKARFCRDWQRTEQQARQRGVGLWRQISPISPWEWRKQR